MIDIEALTIGWLNAVEDQTGAHAASKIPPSLDEPFIRVTLLDGRQDPRIPTLSHGSAYLQVDCYAGPDGGDAEAHRVATAVTNRLHEMPGAHTLGVVTAVNGIGVSNLPDTALDPARDRYVVTATAYAHE